MEEMIIRKIKRDKKILRRLYKLIKSEIDIAEEIIDSESLLKLHLISKIEEDLTDIVYYILDNKNS